MITSKKITTRQYLLLLIAVIAGTAMGSLISYLWNGSILVFDAIMSFIIASGAVATFVWGRKLKYVLVSLIAAILLLVVICLIVHYVRGH